MTIDFNNFNNLYKNISKKDKSLILYSANITLFSPLSNLYQLCTIHSKSFILNSWKAYKIYPQQFILRYLQLHGSMFVKDNISPYATFGVIGILQGVVYGHANIYLANQINIVKKVEYKNLFNGIGYAFTRDTISQGIPFLLSNKLKKNVITPLFPSLSDNNCKWLSIGILSIISTYISHGFHNCQLLMQLHPELNHLSVLKYIKNNYKLLYKGAESRVVLLLITNIFNELYLKDIW